MDKIEYLNQIIAEAFCRFNRLDIDRGVFDRKNQSQEFIKFLIESEYKVDDIINYLNEYKEILRDFKSE